MLSKFKRNVVDLFIGSVSNTLSANLTGTITANTTSTTVTGSGTNFTAEVTVDDRLYIGNESRQIVEVTNTSQLLVSTAFDNEYTANTYKRGKLDNNNYYVFAARQSPYDAEDQAANTIDNDYEGSVFLHDEMMFGKKINGGDVVPVIRKINWQSNTIFSKYDDKDIELKEKDFYILTSENKVYKCLQNNKEQPSTIEPSHTELGYPPEESDGYRWMYLYEINNEQFLTFATENYIPIFENTNVKKAAVDGSIFEFTVIANGSSYPADSGTITTISGNNSLVKIDGDSSTSNDFFSNCAITITNDVINYTYVKEIREYISNTSGNFVVVKEPFANGDIANNQPYSIAPYIKIDSKSGSNCIAYATMQNVSETTFTGSLDKIEIVNPGKNYKQANVSVQTSTGFGTGGLVRAIISPQGGHGFNVKDELFCQSVGVGVLFANTPVFAHSPDVEFRTVGIIKNPLAANTVSGTGTVDLAANSVSILGLNTVFTSEFNIGDYLVYQDEEKEVTRIINDTNLTIKSPFSYSVTDESFLIRRRFSGSHFNQTVEITATKTTPLDLNIGEFVVGSDGAGGGSQVQAKVAFANTTKIVLTGLSKSETRANSNTIAFVNDVQIDGVGYHVEGAATPTITPSGAKYSKVAGNSYITTIPDVELYTGEIMYVQNVLPIQRSNTTNEQVRLVIKF